MPIRHAIHPEAGAHALVMRLKRSKGPAPAKPRYLTRCGKWVREYAVCFQGEVDEVTCATCRQRSQDNAADDEALR